MTHITMIGRVQWPSYIIQNKNPPPGNLMWPAYKLGQIDNRVARKQIFKRRKIRVRRSSAELLLRFQELAGLLASSVM